MRDEIKAFLSSYSSLIPHPSSLYSSLAYHCFYGLLLDGGVVAEAFEPLDAGLPAKPCELALGVVAHIELGLLDGAQKVSLAAQVFDDAAITVCAQSV